MQEPDTQSRVVQFAAILLELGGAALIAVLFGLIRRYAPTRRYFATWASAWLAMVVAISAVAYRYVLLGDLAGGAVPDSAVQARALYLVYQGGKVLYWLLVCRGALEYARPESHWPRWWSAAALVYAVGSTLLSVDLNAILVWQAPVAMIACAAGALALLRVRAGQRSVGSAVTGAVLALSAVLWAVYLVVFAGATGLVPRLAPSFAEMVGGYNSYADMLMIVMLGYAMVVLFMEDARVRISESEARLAAMVASAADAIVTTDASLRLLDANLAAERLFGLRRDSVVGRSLDDLIAPEDRERFRRRATAFLDSSATFAALQATDEFRAVSPAGVPFTIEASASKVRSNETTSLALVVRDVTERRELEERERQTQKMEAVRQLAGGLAHDFNNLLTAIVGRSQFLLDSLPPDSSVREGILEIERTAGAAARLSHGLLALSRRGALHPQRAALNSLVRDTEGAVRARSDTNVSVEFRYADDAGDVHVDRSRLVDVIVAMTVNAYEAMAGRGGQLTVETSRLTWQREAGRNVDTACVVVRDSGPGFDAAARAHLFEPFFSTRGDGRGLGLATAYAFLHQSGGWIDVQSGSIGTTVRLALPVVLGEAVAARTAPAAAVPSRRADSSTRTILLAEDESSVRRLVRTVLEREGWRVLECENGVEALARFESADPPVDVLLTDVVMPQMGGRELAARLVAMQPSLRVIFMSGFVDDSAFLAGLNDQRSPFLQKPFDIASLVSTVRSALSA